MKNIAILVSTLESGGSEKQSILLTNVLSQEHKVFLFVVYGERINKNMYKLIRIHENIKVIYLKGTILKKMYNLSNEMRLNKCSVLFSYLTFPNLIAVIIGNLLRVKKIYGGIRTSALPTWKIWIERFCNRHSTGTIFNNFSGESLFKVKGFQNTFTISNCFTLAPAKEKSSKNKIQIISVGRFVEEKDYLTALISIQKLYTYNKNFNYCIVGYGPLETVIRDQIIKLNLEGVVEIIINASNIPEILEKSDIYLSTSILEGLSNSIMEAMNYFLPVVATDVGDNSMLVRPNKNGFLCAKGDSTMISDCLNILIENPELRIMYGQKSRNVLETEFSEDIFLYNYRNLINN